MSPSTTSQTGRKKPYPPFRRHPLRWLRWHLRENWSMDWEIGPLEIDIEWGPKARYYTFGLCWNRSQDYER